MSKLSELTEGAYQVCAPCGLEFGKNGEKLKSGEIEAQASTFRKAVCDICDDDTSVTEFRDYGYERKLKPGETLKQYLEKRNNNG